MTSKAAGRSGGAGHHQEPSGINAEVKRNSLSQKKFDLGGLNYLEATIGSWGAGHRQGPSGIDAEVKGYRLSQTKFRPRPAFAGLWRAPETKI